MNAKLVLSLAVAVASMMAPLARAQYTPGNGGVYVSPPPSGNPGIYISPSTPSVPSPQAPGMPQPSMPVQPWQTAPPYAPGQSLAPASPEAIRIVQPVVTVPQLSDGQMADLTASIALYPDALLAEMFPAATYVEELTYADKWMLQHPGAPEVVIASLPVHDEVKAIMHYPTVLALLTDHLDWSQAIGTAFLYQRQDLMESVQRWRSTAVAYGTLYSTPQQEIIQTGGVILIQPPPRGQVVYVPVYDPAVVFVRPRVGLVSRNYITFAGGGFSLTFMENDLDWHDHVVYVPRHDHDHPWPENDGRGGRGGDGRGGSGGGTGGGSGGGGTGGGGRGGGGTGGTGGGGTAGGGGTGGGTGGRGGSGTGGGGGRGGSTPAATETRTVFVRDTIKPGLVYPEKIVTPTPDKKVVTIPATPPGRGGPNPGRGPGGGGPPGQNRGGGADGNPNTPF